MRPALTRRLPGLLWAAALIALGACEEPTPSEALLRVERDCRVPLIFIPPGDPEIVAVAGTWNDWGGRADRMLDPDGDGVYVAWVEPPPGRHEYRFWVDNDTFLDPYNPLTIVGDYGWENSLLDVPDCDTPAFEVADVRHTADAVEITLDFYRGDAAAGLSDLQVELGEVPVEVVRQDEEGATLRAPAFDGAQALSVTASDARGVLAQPLRARLEGQTPFDWRDAIIYQVFVDRFRRGDGQALEGERGISMYHGGDLAGVTQALEAGYFDALGANVLWISPMYENPEGRFVGRDGYEAEPYHGYWPAEPREVEERFGGDAALDALVTAAHARGIKVVMDLVLNHLHEEHPYWRERADEGWFNNPSADCICGTSCPWHLTIRTCWFDPFLPDLNWHNPEVVEQLVDDALWWVERFELDGLRVDAVPMMPRYALRHLRARIHERFERAGTHVYLVGETYSQRGEQGLLAFYLGPHTLSGQFDFPVMWALRGALAGRVPMRSLDDEVRASEAAWEGSGAVMAPFLGNHDVPRFLSDVNGDRVWSPRTDPPGDPATDRPFELLELAWTFVLTQPGAPILYYGDEIGLPGGYDPDNRRDMRFAPDLTPREARVLSHVQTLGPLRACSDALRRGERVTFAADINTYVYGRDAGDGEPVVVALNRGDFEATLEIELPAGWAPSGAAFADALGAVEATRRGDRVSVTLGPRQGAVLMPEGARCLGR